MGMAVAFSVMASYLLSRTLIPTLVKYLLKEQHHAEAAAPLGFFSRVHHDFNAAFERFRAQYVALLHWALHHRKWMAVIAIATGAEKRVWLRFVHY